MTTIKIKINTAMRGYAAGRIVSIECDSKGTPLDKFWRRRLKDAKSDKCVEVVKASNSKKEQSK